VSFISILFITADFTGAGMAAGITTLMVMAVDIIGMDTMTAAGGVINNKLRTPSIHRL
jgi:hypothetical protein